VSEGDFGDGTERVSDFGFALELHLSRVSEGNFRDGTERVSDFEVGKE